MTGMNVIVGGIAFQKIGHEHRPGRFALAAAFLVRGPAQHLAQLLIRHFRIAERAPEIRQRLLAGIFGIVRADMFILRADAISEPCFFEYPVDYFFIV